jgi:hypothetical protein
MQLIKLTPDLIVNSWEDIEAALTEAIPTTIGPIEDRNSRVLESLLIGRMDCWVKCKDDGKIVFFVLTAIIDDPEAGSRSMLIYLLYGYLPPTIVEMNETLEFGKLYAKEKKCNRIVAYSNNENVIVIANRLGADTSVRFIAFPVDLP